MKRILSIGQCGPDHASLTRFLTSHFEAEVVASERLDEANAAAVARGEFALVLVNRKLDIDYSDGLDIVRAVRASGATPVMLVTNYAEYQEKAVQAGAVYGFGKLEFQKPETVSRLESVLGPRSAATTSAG